MDSGKRFLTLGIPSAQSMLSRDVNAVTRFAEACKRRDKIGKTSIVEDMMIHPFCLQRGSWRQPR